MDIVLIAGLWLDERAWADVLPGLEERGHRGVPVRLPGQDATGADATTATLDEQLAAVLAAVDAAVGDQVVVVGHSAASTLAWMAADARPNRVRRVVLVGGFPTADGATYADFFAPVDGVVAFPGWDDFAGPDSDDLDEAARARFASLSVTVPATVTQAAVALRDPRRHDVPVDLVCPEFSPADVREAIAAGDMTELAAVRDLELVDLDSGHWPMLSCPDRLAGLLSDATRPRPR